MRYFSFMIGIIGLLSIAQALRAQSSSTIPDKGLVTNDEADMSAEESQEAEDLVVDSTPPLHYTMTGGSIGTAGRVLLYSVSNTPASNVLNQDQVEKSGLSTVPLEYALKQNYPNPFNPSTTIRFELAEASIVSLKLFNSLGQEITTLIRNTEMDEGMQEVEFNAANFASGVYYYRMIAEKLDENGVASGERFTEVKKMVLMK